MKFSPYSSAQAQQWSTVVRQYELGSVYKEGSLLSFVTARAGVTQAPRPHVLEEDFRRAEQYFVAFTSK